MDASDPGVIASTRVERSWPVEIRPIGLAACGTVAWRFRGQLRVTAIVKATFSFTPGGAMELEGPDDVHRADVHHDDDPGASLWAGSDLAPYRLFADVTAVGHAHVPPAGGAVRLTLFRDRAILVDKVIQVAGNAGETDAALRPVPLRYERALGGRRSSDNPVGTGKKAGAALPDLINPADPRRSIGFGAIASDWPSRARLLGALPASALDAEQHDVLDVPSDFDWAYFQAAPAGQTTDFLRGDEWIVLEAMRPDLPLLQTCLPGALGAGRVYGLGGADARPLPIDFHADNLHIDADRGRCSVTWRASFSVPDEDAMGRLVVLAGVEFAGYPISWPDAARIQPAVHDDATQPLAPPAAPAEDLIEELSEEDVEFGMATMVLPPAEEPPALAPAGRQATVLLSWGDEGPPPLAEASEAPPSRRRQATVLLEWSQGGPPGAPAPEQAPGPGRQSTVVLAWSEGVVPQPLPAPRAPQPTVLLSWGDEGAPAASRGLPFAVDMPDDDNPLLGTIPFTDEQAATPMPMPSPFRLAAPTTAPGPAEPLADIPGAPWAHVVAPLVPRPLQAETTRSLVLRETLILPDDLLDPAAPAARPEVAARPPSAPPAHPPSARPPPTHPPPVHPPSQPPRAPVPSAPPERPWSWATVAEGPREEPAPRPPPRIKQQAVVVKNSLYGRFSPPKKK